MHSKFDDSFAHLVSRAAQDAGGASMNELWSSVYQLEQWWWLSRGPADIVPATSELDGVSTAILFTSQARAEAAIRENGLTAHVQGAPIPQAIGIVDRLAGKGIGRVAFNHNRGDQAFFAPIINLTLMADRFFVQFPDELWGPLARAVRESDSPQGWARLNERVATRPYWLLPDPLDFPSHVKHKGRTLALVFTDDASARKWDGACSPIVPRSVVEHLPKVARERGFEVDGYRFNSRTEPFDIDADDLHRFVVLA